MRDINTLYPDYTAEIEAIRKDGISAGLLYRIINKHRGNAQYNKRLMKRYNGLESGVPIFGRRSRFGDEGSVINNKINNDFFSEIVDFATGYFAGKPIGYSYSTADEAKNGIGGDESVRVASKALTDFVFRNNMYDIDMETTKYASICGYAGRLFYIDTEGSERVMVVKPFETIVLSSGELTEPEFGVRYYSVKDINDNTSWKVEFYDDRDIYYYEGNLSELKFIRSEAHMFFCCPLQIVPKNKEMIGDAEKVLPLIDAYDKTLSDAQNDSESFAHAYMVYKNIILGDEEIEKAQKTGTIEIRSTIEGADVYFLTKDINDAFIENLLNRIESNIYRFSKTPNLNDDSFYSASGISLKFKLTGLETKCGMFQAKMQAAGTYMFKLLSGAWNTKGIEIDPLQCMMDFKRNFPLDLLSEAQSCQALISAGLPREVAYSLALSGVDDIDYVMQKIEEEENGIPDLLTNVNGVEGD